MTTLETDMQLALARHLRWMPNPAVVVEPARIAMDGWALPLWDSPRSTRFLVNGDDFHDVSWPLDSPDLAAHFPDLDGADKARFRCVHRPQAGWAVFPQGFARFNVTGPQGEHRRSYRTAWFSADPQLEPEVPSLERIARVIGVRDRAAFLVGGATLANRINELLVDMFGRPLSSFSRILDWGCGAGRLSRYLTFFSRAVVGVDIDSDNIAQCRASITGAEFFEIGLMPPTSFQEGAFDLAIGLSVVTHLAEDVQNAWLQELRRVVRPGGIVLLSIHGLAQMALGRAPVERQLIAHELGFVEVGRNPQLDGVIEDGTYYRDVIQSHDYIFAKWQRYFDVVDIVEAMAGNQDLVILRRRD